MGYNVVGRVSVGVEGRDRRDRRVCGGRDCRGGGRDRRGGGRGGVVGHSLLSFFVFFRSFHFLFFVLISFFISF